MPDNPTPNLLDRLPTKAEIEKRLAELEAEKKKLKGLLRFVENAAQNRTATE